MLANHSKDFFSESRSPNSLSRKEVEPISVYGNDALYLPNLLIKFVAPTAALHVAAQMEATQQPREQIC
jgi:hypothetical protein